MLTDWPSDLIRRVPRAPQRGTALPRGQDAIVIKRSPRHGHGAAVLGTLRKIGLDRLLRPVGNELIAAAIWSSRSSWRG